MIRISRGYFKNNFAPRSTNLLPSLPLTTLREFTMLHLMNVLTDKPGWEEKVRSRVQAPVEEALCYRNVQFFLCRRLLNC